MVRNRPYEWNESARTVERVSPFCREGINVTQSRMSEDSDGRSGSNHHKYRNLNLSYEARPQQQNGQHGTLTAAFIHESMSREKLAECTSEAGLGHYAVITPSQPTTKKKTLHKIASGALANFGSLFGSGGEVVDSRQLSGGNIKSNACTANADGLNLDFNDSGLQNKLSPKERFFSKPWKNRQKVIANVGSSLWVPEDDCLWTSVSGMKVYLTRLNLDELSRPEYVALQHISLAKLRKFHLRSNVIVPKDSHSTRKSLRRAFSLKNKASGINFFDKDKEKDTTGVFAIPLSKAVAQVVENNNEVLDEKVNRSKTSKTKSDSVDDRDGEPVETLRARRHSSSSLSQSLRVTLMESAGEQSPSLGKHSQDSPKWKSRLMDALTLPSSSPSASSLMEKQMALIPMLPQVPLIVQKAIEHLECYGLHVLGIFRVGGSKKRMKQMREQFDSGERTDFTAEDNPHDVAALFKEYFRDLPEPLLTRDLYSAFLESQNEEDKKVQVLVLRLLCYLLPIPNRDTLKALLDFLAQVAHYSEDRQDEKGIQIPGNQMTSRNLATLMGPNILHKVKGQHYAFLVEDVARADERSEVIDVVQSMIEHRTELFEITADGHHEVLAQLLKSDPETVDLILKRRASRSKRASDEVDEVFFKIGESKRVRPLGEPERPLSRAASDPVSRPLLNSASVTPKSDNKNPRGSNSPVPPVRSHSLSQQETILYRNRAYNRMQSFPVENNGGTSSSLFHGSYRDNRRKTPPTMRAARVYRDTSSRETSEPPSPELSSTSRSIYSTPPSSPSGSTQYVSADSSLSHSPLEGSVFGEETPTKARLTCILNEVGVEVSCDQSTYSQNKPNTDFNHLVRGQDVQLEKWMQWESTTQQNGTQSELEQETLV